ncbi:MULTISPECIES: hypothetical protein [unclassified Salinibacterium]|uniref:hypothetical protein n=1 Tax=unclassified Salinibacterium TaxID=2632331 RepID=UPI001F10D148|nr:MULTISPECIES: hypothetical protein [unclassified Salinibacterium]
MSVDRPRHDLQAVEVGDDRAALGCTRLGDGNDDAAIDDDVARTSLRRLEKSSATQNLNH